MGQSGSKSNKEGLLGKSSKQGGDDGCIGNRRVRTITICLLLIVFAVMAAAYCFQEQDNWNDLVNAIPLNVCDVCKNLRDAWTVIVIGGFVTIGFAILAVILLFFNAGDNVEKICGVGLIIGGGLYLGGNIYYAAKFSDIPEWDIDALTDDMKDRINAILSARVGEALLPAGIAILLGLHLFMKRFGNESHRLASNLGNLCIVALICFPCYYVNTNDDNESQWAPTSNTFPYIATGYVVIFWVTLVYIILYIFTYCTCDCKDRACAQIIMAVNKLGLIIGGLLTSFGYYFYAGDLEGKTILFITDMGKETTFYVGYSMLLCTYCFVWAWIWVNINKLNKLNREINYEE